MEQSTFFPNAARRIFLGSPTLQNSNRRIVIPIRMPLDDGSFAGMPDWVSTAYSAVSQYLTEASPEIQQIGELMVAFQNQKPGSELFENPSAKVPNAELRGFSVTRAGEEGEPSIELTFKIYAPFSRDFWKWLGERVGVDKGEVYMAFPTNLPAKGHNASTGAQGSLLDGQPTPAETDALAGDSGATAAIPPSEPGSNGSRKRGRPKKSGPAELAAYHQRQAAKGGASKPN